MTTKRIDALRYKGRHHRSRDLMHTPTTVTKKYDNKKVDKAASPQPAAGHAISIRQTWTFSRRCSDGSESAETGTVGPNTPLLEDTLTTDEEDNPMEGEARPPQSEDTEQT